MAVHIADKYFEGLKNILGDVNDVRRVVIDLPAGQPAVVHIEQFGDERMLDVVRSLDGGVEIRRE